MKKNKLSIIIPSYNESKNLEILLKGIRNLYEVPVYIIDDSNSIENNKIRLLVSELKNVFLVTRKEKKGRGSAVIDGFRKALKNHNTKYFLEMDSDLAHDPKEIERFLNKERLGEYDLIIGSRYLPGGKIKNIEKERTILSRLINIFLRFWLGINITDFTSGFRMYSRVAVKAIVSKKVESTGFITLSETLFRINNKGLKISEVPITWNFRKFGKSNVNFKELLYSFYFVLKMKVQHEISNFS